MASIRDPSPLTDAESAALAHATRARVQRALDEIEAAQNKLLDACGTLSALQHASPEWATIIAGMLARSQYVPDLDRIHVPEIMRLVDRIRIGQ